MLEPYRTQKYLLNGKTLKIIAVDQVEFDDPAQFGVAFFGTDIALVRFDLPAPVRTFVTYHELYHLIDPFSWGGWIGREIRANVVAGICHPLGFIWCTCLTFTMPERRNFYARRFKQKF